MKTILLLILSLALAEVQEPVQAPNERAAITLQTMTEDNHLVLLGNQITEFEKEPKR